MAKIIVTIEANDAEDFNRAIVGLYVSSMNSVGQPITQPAIHMHKPLVEPEKPPKAGKKKDKSDIGDAAPGTNIGGPVEPSAATGIGPADIFDSPATGGSDLDIFDNIPVEQPKLTIDYLRTKTQEKSVTNRPAVMELIKAMNLPGTAQPGLSFIPEASWPEYLNRLNAL